MKRGQSESVSEQQLDLILDTALAVDYPPMPAQTVFFPMPPSTNALWRLTGKGTRVKTKIYTEWESYAGWVIHGQRDLWQRTKGGVILQFLFERASLLSDVDNRLKAVIDLLAHDGVMDDDRRVVALCASWCGIGEVSARAEFRGVPEAVLEGLRASKIGAGMVRVITVLPNTRNPFRFVSSPDAKSGVWLSQEEPN
jgi:Holliday junction resolvase RusA-like endonuclease